MAEIIPSSPKKKGGKRGYKTPGIDLTPMVDLGFLLITFFMYTTTMAKPKVMELQMPYEPAPVNGVAYPEESTVTIIPTAAHRIIWYVGNPARPQSVSRCGFTGVGSLRVRLAAGISAAAALPATFSKDAHQLHVLIKPDTACRYEDFVAVMDEMTINDVQRYAVEKLSAEDHALVSVYGK